MSKNQQVQQTQSTGLTLKATKEMFASEKTVAKFQQILGKKTPGFIASVLQVVSQNELLAKADPVSIFQAAALAATLDLPINNNLGFAYIVPYSGKAQFQMGYKGFIQLAQRSGQFKTISTAEIFEGQLISENPLTGYEFDFTKKTGNTVIGYASYFKLLNGFESTYYMTLAEIQNHAQKFSQSYKYNSSVWKKDFDAMAKKTVQKLHLSKYAPLSIDIQRSIEADQAVVEDFEDGAFSYIDNQVNNEDNRFAQLVEDCTTPEQLETYRGNIENDTQNDIFNQKYHELNG